MGKWSGPITADVLEDNKDIPDSEVLQDILETRREVRVLEEKLSAIREKIDDRNEFVSFLQRLQTSRRNMEDPF